MRRKATRAKEQRDPTPVARSREPTRTNQGEINEQEEEEESSKDSDEEEIEIINDVENRDGIDSSSRPVLFDGTDNYGDYNGYDPGIPYSTSPYTSFPSSSFFSPSPSLSVMSQSPPPPSHFSSLSSPYMKPPPASPPMTSATSPPETSPGNQDDDFIKSPLRPPISPRPLHPSFVYSQSAQQNSARQESPYQPHDLAQRPRPKRSQSVMTRGNDTWPHFSDGRNPFSSSQPSSPVKRPGTKLRRSNSSSNLEQLVVDSVPLAKPNLPPQPPTQSQPPRSKPYHNLMVRDKHFHPFSTMNESNWLIILILLSH